MYSFLKDAKGGHFREHHNYPYGEKVTHIEQPLPENIKFLNRKEAYCLEVKNIGSERFVQTSYFIGVDWLVQDKLAIYVAPKLNNGSGQINYLEMLFKGLSHPETLKHTNDLFEIKFDAPYIEIEREQDLLTPLLVLQFLRVVKEIVRKGLKKSYYKVEANLYGKVKGKVLVSATIKHNSLKNKPLHTYCSYDEFGFNGVENRLIKKTLLFARDYLTTLKVLGKSEKHSSELFNYIMPAFEVVSEDVEVNVIKHTKFNPFYKEYDEAIRLAKLLLKKNGYNLTQKDQKLKVKTPPFWIDMSKLFELYVLDLLKNKFSNDVVFQFQANYGQPDYLLKSRKMVMDAKYKTVYQIPEYDMENIRQLSGYARDMKVVNELDAKVNEVVDCLIIYPDQNCGKPDFENCDLKQSEITQFSKFFKYPIKLPVIHK